MQQVQPIQRPRRDHMQLPPLQPKRIQQLQDTWLPLQGMFRFFNCFKSNFYSITEIVKNLFIFSYGREFAEPYLGHGIGPVTGYGVNPNLQPLCP